MREPESAKECIYLTNRYIGEKGEIFCWVFKNDCPECGKAKMGKPIGENGKVKIRAKEYVCAECGHTVEKKEYEETLTASIKYTCDKCENKGEIQIPFKRKKVKGVDSLAFNCEKCGEKILITKKMKSIE